MANKLINTDGEKLYAFLNRKYKGYKEWLAITTFSRDKMYRLFKQHPLAENDKEQLSKEYSLPENFFPSDNPIQSPNIQYEIVENELRVVREELLSDKERISELKERIDELKAALSSKDKVINILERQLENHRPHDKKKPTTTITMPH